MRLIILLFLVAAGTAKAEPSMRTLWKARGLDAFEKVEGQADSNPNTPQSLEVMLEFAYAMHAAKPELVHKPWTGGGDAFHLLLNAGSGAFFDIVYLYEADGTLTTVRIDSLPKGWNLTINHGKMQSTTVALVERHRARLGVKDLSEPQPLLVKTDSGVLVFDLVDPFNAFVLERELNVPSIVGKTPEQFKKELGLNAPAVGKEQGPKPATGNTPTEK